MKFLKGAHGTLNGEGPDGNVEGVEALAFNVKNTVKWSAFKANIPEIVADSGYTKNGWNPSIPADTEAVEAGTYTAQYTQNVVPGTGNPTNPDPDKYVKLTMDANGGEITGESFYWVLKTYEVKAADVDATTATKAGAGFKSWDTTAAGGTAFFPKKLTEDATAYAQYTNNVVKTDTPTINQPVEGATEITGTAEPGANVTVTFPGNKTVEVIAGEDGKWTADVPSEVNLKVGDEITAEAKVDGKEPSDKAQTTVADLEDSMKPNINQPTAGDTKVTGTAEPGANVTVTFPGDKTVEVTADEDGNWTADVPSGVDLEAGDEITAKAKEEGKNVSDEATTIVKDAPVAEKSATPTIDDVTAGNDKITGTAVPGANVTVTFPGNKTVEVTADEDGKWTADVPNGVNLEAGDEITAKAKEEGKEVSDPATATVAAIGKVKLIFDPNGGVFSDGSTIDKVYTVDKDNNFKIIDAPKKDGYVFDYWKGSKYKPGENYVAAADHKFVAQWLKDTDGDGKPDVKDSDNNKNGGNPSINAGRKSPNTGDSGMTAWLIMFVFASIATGGGIFYKRKIKHQ